MPSMSEQQELPPAGLRSVAFGVLHSGPSHNLLRPASRNSYLAGPSPYPCPGVDTPAGDSSCCFRLRVIL